MAIEIFIEPGATYSWKEFVKSKDPFAIALDGIVNEPTKRIVRNSRGEIAPYSNFDHHSGVDRVSTRATSEQVHLEINLGLFRTYRVDGIPYANVFVNDIDEDVGLATWLLLNHERVTDHAEPSINRLVYCEDRLDATAGAYPLGDVAIRRKMAWMFEPYQRARYDGTLIEMDTSGMKSILESMWARITAYTLDKGEEIGLDGQFETIGGGPGWNFVKETGPAARLALYASGIDAFASYLGSSKAGLHKYVIGKRSDWIPFNLDAIINRLNEEDPAVDGNNKWGGSSTIGGSPRMTGSKLSPKKLEALINKVICDG